MVEQFSYTTCSAQRTHTQAYMQHIQWTNLHNINLNMNAHIMTENGNRYNVHFVYMQYSEHVWDEIMANFFLV